MTNPEHEELVKLADELIAQNYGNVRDIDTMEEHFALLAKAASALRRLASSDGAVKGEPEPVASERISRLAADLVVSGWTAGDHGIELAKSRAERKLLEFACDEIERHMRFHTAPPADAGMREAVRRLEELDCLYVNGERYPFGGIVGDPETAIRREAIKECIAALTTPGATCKVQEPESYTTTHFDEVTCKRTANCTWPDCKCPRTAPGATTKSDGGVEGHAGLAHGGTAREAPTSTTGCLTSPAQVDAAGIKPGPSDPSSIRSDVTVERVARIKSLLASFHRNSCYPEAMTGELNDAAERILATGLVLDEATLKTKLTEAEWLIRELCGHEGAEGFSEYLNKRLEAYEFTTQP